MGPNDYTVVRIEGEYCYLKDVNSGNEIFIAIALLPPNVDVGTKIHEEMFEYTVVE